MIRRLICLATLLLASCADGTPRSYRDPAYPDQPTYQAFVRQHFVLTEGKVLAHFPGLLDCKVEALTDGYTPDEMKVLDAYAQKRIRETIDAALTAEKDRTARSASVKFYDRHPECADIRAQPGAFSSGKDYVIQSFLNNNAPLFDKQGVPDDLGQASASCYWNVLQSHLSQDELQALDDFAKGGPRYAISSEHENVKHDELVMACPQTMVKLDIDLTEYTYSAGGGWPAIR